MKINYLKDNNVQEIDVRYWSNKVYFKLYDMVKCLDLQNIDEEEALKRMSKILGENGPYDKENYSHYITFEGLKDLKKSIDFEYVCKEESFNELFEFISSVLDGLKKKKESNEEEKLSKEFNYHLQEGKKHIDAALEFQRKLLEINKLKENLK